MKWSEKYTINANDCDINNIVSTSGLQYYIQDCANRAMAGRGPSYENLMKEKKSFLLSKIRTSFYKPLYARDEIEVLTWACESKNVIYPRCYQVKKDGLIVAEATSIWALIDIDKHRFVRNSDMKLNYDTDEMLDLDIPGRMKIPSHLQMSLVGEKNIMYSDCDMNKHFHNTKYHDVICDFLPDMDGKRVVSMEVDFLNEARMGNTLKFYFSEEDDIYYIRSIREDGKTNIESEIMLENI